jgi:hypothetical protein
MFGALKIIIDDYLKFKKKWENRIGLTISQMDFLISTRQHCVQLLKDIKYNKYTQQILKVVAPKYDFDTYTKSVDFKKEEKQDKILVEQSDDSENERPIKKKKKVNNDSDKRQKKIRKDIVKK